MHITGLDKQTYNWYPNKTSHPHQNTSKYHKKAKMLLTKLFPFDKIYEEVTLPGSKYMNQDLVADFYIPNLKAVVEVQGEHHFKFISYFHDSVLEYHRGKARDRNKKQWCYVNNIKYISLSYDEDITEWENKIRDIKNEKRSS